MIEATFEKVSLFTLGRTVGTPAAIAIVDDVCEVDMGTLMLRHQRGEWGELCDEDREVQLKSLREGAQPERIMSVHRVNGVKLWIITEWDRSATTLLLPEEY